MEERQVYTVADNSCTMVDATRVKRSYLSTLNLDEIDRNLDELERKLVPFLNRVRAMRGKKPIRIDD